MIHTGECREGKQRPLVVVGRDQTTAAAGQHIEIFCGTVDLATGLGAPGELVGDVAAP